MTLATLLHGVLLLSLPWLALEVGSKLLEQHIRSSHARVRLLQLYTRLRGTRVPLASSLSSSQHRYDISLSRGALWVKAESCAFNALPTAFLRGIGAGTQARRRGQRRKDDDDTQHRGRRPSWLGTMYDVGVLFAVLALIASAGMMVWGAFRLIGDIVEWTGAPAELKANEGQTSLLEDVLARSLQRRQTPLTLPVRGSSNTTTSSAHSTWSPKLVPLIPGLTLPWSHMLPFIAALVMTQVIHEAGHAVCAALHNIHPLRMGVILLFPAIPGAFVVLPETITRASHTDVRHDEDGSTSMDNLSTLERGAGADAKVEIGNCSIQVKMRIVAAGVWHNAVIAVLLGLLLAVPIGQAFHDALWSDAGGMRILHVARSSPLSLHLSPGSLLTHLDDVDLRGEAQVETWNAYLTYQASESGASHLSARGWCVSADTWRASSTSCCDKYSGAGDGAIGAFDAASSLCFVTADDLQGRCYDPHLLVEDNPTRCTRSCPEGVCIFADEREDLLRITVAAAPSPKTSPNRGPSASVASTVLPQSPPPRVVLFQGSRYAVRLAVSVSPYDFRFGQWKWPEQMFQWTALIIRYTFTLSLAMALFNMLPLPSLDGDLFLGLLLHSWQLAEHSALEDGDCSDDFQSDDVKLTGVRDECGAQSQSMQRSMQDRQWRAGQDETGEQEECGDRRSPRTQHQHSPQGSNSPMLHYILRPPWPRGRLQAKVGARVHARIRWAVLILAVFVMGGSVVLHVLQAGR